MLREESPAAAASLRPPQQVWLAGGPGPKWERSLPASPQRPSWLLLPRQSYCINTAQGEDKPAPPAPHPPPPPTLSSAVTLSPHQEAEHCFLMRDKVSSLTRALEIVRWRAGACLE